MSQLMKKTLKSNWLWKSKESFLFRIENCLINFQLLHDHYFPTGVVGNWKDVSTANMDKVQFSVIAESGLTVDVILGGEDMFLHYSSQDDLDYLAKQLYSMIFRIIGMYDWQEVNYTGFLIKNHLNHAEILRAWHKDEDQLITLAQNLYMQHIVPRDVDDANQILHQKKITSCDKKTLIFFFNRVTEEISNGYNEEQKEIYQTLKSFKRCYEFLLQVSDLEDIELQKKYDFIIYLLKYMNINKPGEGYDLTNKVRAYNFNQKKTGEFKDNKHNSSPVVKLPVADSVNLSEEKKKRLSEIIKEINEKTGSDFDEDVAVKSMLQIKDLMMKSKHLKSSAANNKEKDFELTYFDNIDNILVDGLDQNQKFFTFLLKNKEFKKEILGTFAEEIYKALRKGIKSEE